MKLIYCDCETTPLSDEALKKFMPAHLVNPVMPEEFKNPVFPKAEELEAPKTFKDPEKIAAWREKKLASIIEGHAADKAAWEQKQIADVQKFIDGAALDARYSNVRMIGLRSETLQAMAEGDPDAKPHTFIGVFEPGAATTRTLTENQWPSGVQVTVFDREEDLLAWAFNKIKKHTFEAREPEKLCGYNTHGFDLSYLFRRGWIKAVIPFLWMRKGRYWDDRYTIDIREVWQLGDRQVATDGMNGLCRILGVQQKTGDGKYFWRMYRDNPIEAVLYHLSDLQCTECLAQKMGLS